ncbi:MAG: efflux RND transporter periplasmic adaptor subunit [Betaproteobacteria bacterium]|nr:efflux RND transporter periplasmic adaptor subunit [Betaproteobacteria bacterium]
MRFLLPILCAALIAPGVVVAAEPVLEFDCLVEARQSIDVRSPVEGVIEAVLVERGALVKKGQEIARLASGPERAAVNLARSRSKMEGDVKAAQTRVEITQKKWQRAEELVKKNFVSANARDEAEAEYRLAEEQLRAARENRRLAQLELKRAEEILAQRTIRSPVNGVVAEVVLHPGELATSNQKDPIVRLQEIDPLNVELILPVAAFGKIREGQKAVVTLEQPVGGSYSARVEVVDRMVDAASGTFGVRLQLPNPDGRIPAGVKCRAKF